MIKRSNEMNARIKELIIKAQDRSAQMEQELFSQGASASDFFPEILIELVVRECANMLDEDSYLMPELGGYAHDMRNRFGVK
jgi:hypothetical protein